MTNEVTSLACEQALVWVLCARCETRVAKPRERGVRWAGLGEIVLSSPSPAHLAPRSRGFAACLVASPLASRISRIKPKREPARRL